MVTDEALFNDAVITGGVGPFTVTVAPLCHESCCVSQRTSFTIFSTDLKMLTVTLSLSLFWNFLQVFKLREPDFNHTAEPPLSSRVVKKEIKRC